MRKFTTLTEAKNSLPTTCRQSGIMYRCVDTGNLYLIETLASGEVSMRMMVVSESIELMSPTKPCFQGPTKPCFQVNMVNLVEEYMKNANTEDIKIFNDMYHPDRNG